MSEVPQFPGPFGGFDLNSMLKFLQTDGPVHWEIARQFAQWSATGGEAADAVASADRPQLSGVGAAAESRVLSGTGEPPAAELAFLGRAEFADRLLAGLRPVLERLSVTLQAAPEEGGGPEEIGPGGGFGVFGPGGVPGTSPEVPGASGVPGAANPLASMFGALGPLLLGVQCGFLIGQLAQSLLSTHDVLLPIADPPRPALVVPNVADFGGAWSIPADDLRFYLSLSEAVRARVCGRAWIRDRLVRLACEYVGSFKIDPSAFEAQLGALDFTDPSSAMEFMPDPDAVLGAMQTPGQLVTLERLQATTALFESYSDTVAERFGEPVLRSLRAVREAVHRHRSERTAADRFVARLLGIDPSRRLHKVAESFCAGVVERAGPDALDRILTGESFLPTPAELEAPGLWLARLELFDPAGPPAPDDPPTAGG